MVAMPINPVVAIIGTTGTGKSQLAVDLALRFNGEIINADAVQMYEGLPIITNKISVEERKGVPHHLLGCIGLKEPSWRVDKFVRKAGDVIKEIRSRGKLPIVVGGTHYYTQSLLFHDSLSEPDEEKGPVPEDESKDADEEFPILQGSTDELLDRLRSVDPVMAQRWHPRDRRKIRRSLEIFYKTGRKASDIYTEQKSRRSATPLGDQVLEDPGDSVQNIVTASTGLLTRTLFLWTHTPRDALKARLRHRVDQMVDDGLIEEAQELKATASAQSSSGEDVDTKRGVYISIGYKELVPYLEARQEEGMDNKTLETLRQEAIEKVNNATWQYAKYQERWIRIKLLGAIKAAGAEDSIRVIDTSVPSNWNADVAAPACAIVEAFLDGQDLSRTEPSVEAYQALEEAFQGNGPQASSISQTQTCKICDVTATTEKEWQRHVTSNRHRKTVKYCEKHGLSSSKDNKNATR